MPSLSAGDCTPITGSQVVSTIRTGLQVFYRYSTCIVQYIALPVNYTEHQCPLQVV